MSSTEVYRIEIPITVEDNYTEEIQKAEKAILALQKQLGKDVKIKGISDFESAKKSASSLEREVKKVQSASSAASKEVSKVSANVDKQMARAEKSIQDKANVMQRIGRRKQMIEIGVRDSASRTIGYVQSKMNNLRNARAITFTIGAIDRATRVLGGIRRSITSIPAVVTIALSYVGVQKLGEATLGAAMRWEEYEVAMSHWLGGNVKQAKELTKWMGQYADTTPFSSPELFPALTRGVGISNGDIKKSKELLKISADMAALTPGKTVEDAMEALADAKMGEMARLVEFGLKMSKKEFDKVGFEGVMKELAKQYEGGAGKLSKTASGIIATLQGYRGSLLRAMGTGFLEPMKPRLDKINQWLENNQETWGGWKKTVSQAGKEFSEFAFSKGEGLFNYLSDVFNSAENKDLTVGAKIKIVAKDTQSYFKNWWDTEAAPAIGGWWDSSGEQLMIDTGTLMAKAILKGMGVALKEGVGILSTLWGDIWKNREENGLFSKETGGSLLKFGGASLLAGWGAMKVLKPFISGFKGMKNLWGGSKNLWDKFRSPKTKDTPKTKETTSTKPTGGSYSEQTKQKSQNKYPSNEGKTKSTSYTKDKTKSKSFMDTIKDFKMPKGVSKWAKRIPVLGAALSIADGLSSGSSWSGVAGSAAGGWAGAKLGAGGGAALGSFLGPGGTLAGSVIGGVGGGIGGAIGGEKFANWLTGKISGLFSSKTASAAETTSKANNTAVTSQSPASTTKYTPSTSTQSTGSNALIEQKAQALAKQLEDSGNALHQSVYNILTSFAEVNTSIKSFKTNFDNLVQSSSEVTGSLKSTFAPLQIRGLMLGTSMDLMTMTLMQSASYVSSAYTPLAPKGFLLNAGMSVLIISTLQASASVASFSGISEKVNALKSAIDGLRSRINNVSLPSVPSVPSAAPAGPKKSLGPVRSGGGYVPYANGGLINRPHMGLVGEAGPEAIIPLSPSRRGRGRELLYRAASALGVQPYADGGLVGGNIIEGYGDISTGNNGASISIGDILPQVQITVQANENGHVDLSNVSDEILDQIGVKLANKVMEAASNMMVG
ncbi:hypothetical protein [Lysinibacillus sp. Bpr_S20]|uniref:hypothetical protein n=1 Tax=Lysinibacillus sp. Bpr_S20 TaxID=2933964 RepID=UPI0020124041|nr:hypothetical protein [Lysinibacillus sp. Bpr_S20]MCL1701628.1 hypothetical protein [Lysinibacillus sp. Bpr_S20]